MLYIGKAMQDRMNILGLTADDVAEKAFVEKETIDAIIQNKIALEEIDEFDMSLICSTLHCKPEYFADANMKEKDLLMASMNRGLDNKKSMEVKARIQDFMIDFAFIKDILLEMGEVYS